MPLRILTFVFLQWQVELCINDRPNRKFEIIQNRIFMNTRFFSSHEKRLDALKCTRVDFAVRFLLGQHLDPLGINPHFHYLSTLADPLKPEVETSVSLFDEALVSAARDDEHLELLRRLGVRSYVIVPMVARGHMLGAMTFVTAESGRRFGDIGVVQFDARRAALVSVGQAFLSALFS